jgi:membrane protein
MNRSALSPGNLWSMAKESVTAWIDDYAPSMGASIAYYTAFSIAPVLIIVIAVAGFVWGDEAASGYLYAQLGGILGDDGAKAVQAMVESANSTNGGIVATVVGVVLLFVGATTVFAELQSDLDRIWKAPAAQKSEGLWGLIRSRVLSLGLVVSIGFLLLVSLVVSAALAALGNLWGGVFDNLEWLVHILDFVVSIAVVTVMFALMYKILPRVSIAWHDVWIGAVVTALLFAVGKFLVGLYVGKTSVASSFGTAGSLAVLLVWVYYSAQIFLLGAEFTWIYAHRFGSRQGEDKPATAKETMPTTESPGGKSKAAPRRPQLQTQPAIAQVAPKARTAAALAAGAIVLGAIAGRVLDRTHRA